MRYNILICLLTISTSSHAQTISVIATLTNGLRDTLKFGFVQNATLNEDNSLGEQNIFMSPINGYEGRILQRDSSNYSCAMQFDGSRIYYPANFDSKINYRNLLDTSMQNRLFELWYSDNQTDSLEFICDIPLKSFLSYGLVAPQDCFGDPPSPIGILQITDDTVKHVKEKLQPGLGIKQYILITNPNITITALDEKAPPKNTSDISVYPNPTLKSFSVLYSNPEDLTEISVFDSIGKLIQHFDSMPEKSEIDLRQFYEGIYFVSFVIKNGDHIIKKVIKQ